MSVTPKTVVFGDPIYNWSGNEIWGYWAEDMNFVQDKLKFQTVTALLGGADHPDGNPEIRDTYVQATSTGQWRASMECLQKDFQENPMFFMHPLQGPEATLAALRLLLRDRRFGSFFRESVDEFKAYERHLTNEARIGPLF